MGNNAIDLHESTLKNFVESLRPEDKVIREKLDFGYSYDGKVAILYEIRPVWNNPEEIENIGFARIRFYNSRKEWNLYWKRASGKWELYEPFPKSTALDKIIKVIREDKHFCFFG